MILVESLGDRPFLQEFDGVLVVDLDNRRRCVTLGDGAKKVV